MPVRQVVRATMVASLLVPVTGCIHQHRSAGAPEGVADELPEPAQLADQDPDPATDPGGPQFCNPAGKQGAELKKCLASNDSVSRSFADEAKKREPWFNFAPDSWVTSTE